MTADATLHTRLLAAVRDPMYNDVLSEDIETMIEQLAGALRAVVELHAPVRPYADLPFLRCSGCGLPPARAQSSPWPCSTIQAIADQLGLTQDHETHREEDRRG